MKTKLILFGLLVTLGISVQAKNYTYKTVDGDMLKTRIYTLDNGLKVYLSVNAEKPRIQTYIAVRTGSKNDPAETTGLAHYLGEPVRDSRGAMVYEVKANLSDLIRMKELMRQKFALEKIEDEPDKNRITIHLPSDKMRFYYFKLENVSAGKETAIKKIMSGKGALPSFDPGFIKVRCRQNMIPDIRAEIEKNGLEWENGKMQPDGVILVIIREKRPVYSYEIGFFTDNDGRNIPAELRKKFAEDKEKSCILKVKGSQVERVGSDCRWQLRVDSHASQDDLQRYLHQTLRQIGVNIDAADIGIKTR